MMNEGMGPDEIAASLTPPPGLETDWSTRGYYGALAQNARLSSREWEVADGLAKGLSTNDIADMLFIGDNTVRTHVASILRKLRVSTRDEAVELLREVKER